MFRGSGLPQLRQLGILNSLIIRCQERFLPLRPYGMVALAGGHWSGDICQRLFINGYLLRADEQTSD